MTVRESTWTSKQRSKLPPATTFVEDSATGCVIGAIVLKFSGWLDFASESLWEAYSFGTDNATDLATDLLLCVYDDRQCVIESEEAQ
ncbi:Uncharacterised protein [uncultured archaeon]|nr:Uncharacterised protein [uncultured archaeon]